MRENALGAGTQHDDVLAIVHRHLGQRVVLRFAQRLEQQRVRLLAAFVGRHVVGALQIDRIDVVGLDEFQDLHHLGGLGRDLLDVFVVDLDVVILLVLVALDQFAARHGLVFRLAVDHLPDARMVVFVEQIEADGFAARGAE